jgi:CheY-like chemotaxis protein
LSTVYGIVKQGGGAITVYSEPGAGATFRTYFPRSDEAPDSFPPTTAKVVPGGNETVLLVDDADPLRELTQRLLEDCGYTVLSSGDPAEALRIAEQHSGSIPLLITDMMMVGFSGSVLAARLAEFRPETKVLYASGHIDHSLVQRGVRGKDYAFLEKPFSRDDLLRKVRDLLDAGLHLPRIS